MGDNVMFHNSGPFYEAQKKNQSRPTFIQTGVIVTDGFRDYQILGFEKINGADYAAVKCVTSVNINEEGRVGYRSLKFLTTQCWR